MTLSEIARNVGVCKATVSLVLNGKAKEHHISDRTIRAVEEYCRSINYRPNIHAIRMGRKIVGNIMFLLNSEELTVHKNNFEDYNVAQITGGITQKIMEYDSSLTIRIFKVDMDGETIFNAFRSHEIDGMIYYGLTIPEQWIRVFQEEQFKVVGIGIRPREGISTVNINNREISRTLTETLIEQNCRRFLYFAGLESSYPGPERYAGFCEALDKHNISHDGSIVMEGNFSEEKAFHLMERYCKEKNPLPHAVICANDSMAIGVIRALQKHNVDVPRDVKVAGGDNILLSSYVSPSLTTFENLPGAMGSAAVELLQRQIRNHKYQEENIVLESRIIQRESSI